MVKADPKKDYYADLELPSTADHDEVKKQFRLLGTWPASISQACDTHPLQPKFTILIEIAAMSSKLPKSSRLSKQLMRSSATLLRRRSMTPPARACALLYHLRLKRTMILTTSANPPELRRRLSLEVLRKHRPTRSPSLRLDRTPKRLLHPLALPR
jgi:hypothetical protein